MDIIVTAIRSTDVDKYIKNNDISQSKESFDFPSSRLMIIELFSKI
jgi:hypothetical protein